MPEDGIVALDNGMYKIWFARNYRSRGSNTLLLDNALATMGAGLPSAMMAAMLHPDRRVLAVCGDGGFMMNSQELETAVRLKLNLVVLILRDNGYGMIRWKQAVDHFPDWGLTFGNPDFVKYAEAYGAKGSRVEATDDLVPTLEAAFAEGGVHLVTVPIDYSENMRVLVDELKNRVPAAAGMKEADGMKTRAAVLSAMGTPGPYAALQAAGDRGTGARPARAGRGAGADQGRGPVPFRPVGDQWRPAAAAADGARATRRPASSRRSGQGSPTSPAAIMWSACSSPPAAIAARAPKAGRPCASRVRP